MQPPGHSDHSLSDVSGGLRLIRTVSAMNLRSCKTSRWLWLTLSLLFFVAIGFAPLFRYGKTAESSVLRLAPSLVEKLRSGYVGFRTVVEVVLWLSFAIALGWLAHCFVVILFSWIHDKGKTQR